MSDQRSSTPGVMQVRTSTDRMLGALLTLPMALLGMLAMLGGDLHISQLGRLTCGVCTVIVWLVATVLLVRNGTAQSGETTAQEGA